MLILAAPPTNVLLGSFALPQFPATVFTPLAPLRGNSNQYFGTIRLRAGYALDRVFLYGTGGLAFGGLRNNGNGFGGGFSETTLAGNFDPVAGAVVANDTTNFVGAAARKSSSRTSWNLLGLGGEYLCLEQFERQGQGILRRIRRTRTPRLPSFFQVSWPLPITTEAGTPISSGWA